MVGLALVTLSEELTTVKSSDQLMKAVVYGAVVAVICSSTVQRRNAMSQCSSAMQQHAMCCCREAGLQQEKEDKNLYMCPTYCVPTRRHVREGADMQHGNVSILFNLTSPIFSSSLLFSPLHSSLRPHFVFVAQLRTKQPAAKWTLAGVAIILDIGILVVQLRKRRENPLLVKMPSENAP